MHALLFRSHYFHFDFSFLVFLPIIIDLVFALSYHATLEYDFWYCDCFYPFCLLICYPSQESLAQIT